MENVTLEQYLYRQIPLSAAMQVTVSAAQSDTVILSAPLGPNVNHKCTAFGGSISALGILAAWSLVHLRLLDEGLVCEVVIQSNRMDYERPITGPFTAASSLPDPGAWPAFVKTLTRRRLARIEVRSDLIFDNAVVGRLSGRFVAFLQEP
jgi:thioesterase domain-containing protein